MLLVFVLEKAGHEQHCMAVMVKGIKRVVAVLVGPIVQFCFRLLFWFSGERAYCEQWWQLFLLFRTIHVVGKVSNAHPVFKLTNVYHWVQCSCGPFLSALSRLLHAVEHFLSSQALQSNNDRSGIASGFGVQHVMH